MTTSNEHNNAPAVPQGDPIAWKYELAVRIDADGRGSGWCWHLTDYKPSVPDGMIRNLRPLTYADAAPAVPQGWKLVPVEPTRAMWAAVNKLDDEMAAGSYDGKGCSIEQAWNCMLDFAPDAPALEATPAPAPAQYKDSTPQLSVGESSFESWFESYNPANKGDKQRSRDAYAAGMGDPLVAAAPAQGEPFGYFRPEPFGWTDCAEDDEGAIALYERPQEVGLTDEGRQQVFIAAERRMVREPNLSWRDAIVDEVIAALRAKEQSCK